MVRRFSSLKASEKTKCALYPCAAQIRAREIPVVPAVYSTTVPPGGSLPSAAARSTMARATRSFMLPVGLADSSFAMMRADPAGTTRRGSTRGVLPMASRTCRDVLMTKPWLPEGLTLAPLHRVAGLDAVGPLGAHPVPAPAAVRRNQGAPASRTARVAACSLRLPPLQTDLGVRSHRGAPSHRDGAANAAPRARTPPRAPRESRHAPAALARLRTRLRPS